MLFTMDGRGRRLVEASEGVAHLFKKRNRFHARNVFSSKAASSHFETGGIRIELERLLKICNR